MFGKYSLRANTNSIDILLLFLLLPICIFNMQLSFNCFFFFCSQYGEFDCWDIECPPLTCDKPLPLAPGDCCPRCEDDPCNFLVGINETGFYAGKPCTYKGHQYESGQAFSDMSSQCTTCACKVDMLFPLLLINKFIHYTTIKRKYLNY